METKDEQKNRNEKAQGEKRERGKIQESDGVVDGSQGWGNCSAKLRWLAGRAQRANVPS